MNYVKPKSAASQSFILLEQDVKHRRSAGETRLSAALFASELVSSVLIPE